MMARSLRSEHRTLNISCKNLQKVEFYDQTQSRKLAEESVLSESTSTTGWFSSNRG